MSLPNLTPLDLAGWLLGFVFTLCIFSYVIGDNFLFRLAIHIFIGVSAAFAVMIAWNQVLWPQLLQPLLSGSRDRLLLTLVPLALALLLLAKTTTRLAGFGSLPMAFLVGVGVATAIGGAVMGTLFPQVTATINLFALPPIQDGDSGVWVQLFNAFIVGAGTITTLAYFHFGARARPGAAPERAYWIETWAWVGQIFLAVTFGALFAGVLAAALAALVERLGFLVTFLRPLIMP